jgi:hypothetical protein
VFHSDPVPTPAPFTATDLLREAEHLLGLPVGELDTRLVEFEFRLPPATHVGHEWAELRATWECYLPSAAEITAIGRALYERSPACRARYANADTGLICRQVGAQFSFAHDSLSCLPICREPDDPAETGGDPQPGPRAA